MYRFDINTDYKEQFKRYVDVLVADINATVDDRKQRIADLTNAYIEQTGQRPDHRQLDRLAEWLLRGHEEELKNERN